jgi:hypothetical protein
MHQKTMTDLMEFVHVIGAPVDDATRLLRLHGLSEYFIERILIHRLPKGSLIAKDERFSYYHKLQIAVALKALNPQTIGALRKLTKIRNRCAHVRKPVVEIQEIIEMGRIIGPLFERAINDYEGDNKEFRALAYALFTELSNQTTAVEIAAEKLQMKSTTK